MHVAGNDTFTLWHLRKAQLETWSLKVYNGFHVQSSWLCCTDGEAFAKLGYAKLLLLPRGQWQKVQLYSDIILFQS